MNNPMAFALFAWTGILIGLAACVVRSLRVRPYDCDALRHAYECGRASVEKREGLPHGYDMSAELTLAWLRGRVSAVEDKTRRHNTSPKAVSGSHKRTSAHDAVDEVCSGLPRDWRFLMRHAWVKGGPKSQHKCGLDESSSKR